MQISCVRVVLEVKSSVKPKSFRRSVPPEEMAGRVHEPREAQLQYLGIDLQESLGTTSDARSLCYSVTSSVSGLEETHR